MSRSPRSLRFVRLLLASAPVLASLQACGRSEPGDYLLYDDDGTSGSATGGSVGTGGAGTAGTLPGKGGMMGVAGTAIGGSTGTGGAGSLGGAGGKGGTGAGGGVAGVGGVITGGVAGVGATGSAGEPNPPDVTCGGDKCDAATESCCVSVGGFACIANTRACNGAVLDCTSADDCAGGAVCCLTFTSPTGSASVCKDRCSGMNQDSERQLCSTDAECMGNRRCVPTVFGVSVCTRRP